MTIKKFGAMTVNELLKNLEDYVNHGYGDRFIAIENVDNYSGSFFTIDSTNCIDTDGKCIFLVSNNPEDTRVINPLLKLPVD